VTSEPPGDPPGGPPGGRIFSLEGRPAPALYLLGWLLSFGGIAVLFVATVAQPSLGRTIAALLGVCALGLGLATAAGYQVVARADRHPSRYRGPSPFLLFGVVLVVGALLSGLLGSVGLADGTRPLGFLVGLLVVAVTYLGCVTLFVVRTGALSWTDMGWPTDPRDRVARSLRAIGTAVIVLVPLTIALSLVGGIVALLLGVDAPDVLPATQTSADALAVAIAAAVVAPVGEEAFFRGFALSAWLRDLGPRAALWRSAAFFAFVHIVNISADTFGQGLGQAILEFVVILPLGLALGWLFLRHGLTGAIAGHVTYNAFLLLLLLIRSLAPATS
jgi:membrane protease YdiL (CAAX protease family)